MTNFDICLAEDEDYGRANCKRYKAAAYLSRKVKHK